MNIDSNSLAGNVDIQKFSLSFLSLEGTPSSPEIKITYKAYGPSSTTDSLISYEYSIDSGVTYKPMTLKTPSEADNITVSGVGSINEITWEGYEDEGLGVFGTNILLKFVFSDGTHISPTAQGTFVIEKEVSTPESRVGDQIKQDSHVGLNGSALVNEILNPGT